MVASSLSRGMLIRSCSYDLMGRTLRTSIELWLWRDSCVGSIVFALVTMQFKKVELWWYGGLALVQLGCPLLYVVCRLMILAEVIAAFRALPTSTYQTYDVANYWLHIRLHVVAVSISAIEHSNRPSVYPRPFVLSQTATGDLYCDPS